MSLHGHVTLQCYVQNNILGELQGDDSEVEVVNSTCLTCMGGIL